MGWVRNREKLENLARTLGLVCWDFLFLIVSTERIFFSLRFLPPPLNPKGEIFWISS